MKPIDTAPAAFPAAPLLDATRVNSMLSVGGEIISPFILPIGVAVTIGRSPRCLIPLGRHLIATGRRA